MSQRVRKATAVAIGLAMGAGLGTVYGNVDPSRPFALAVLGFTVVTGPFFVTVVWRFLLGRREIRAEAERHRDDIERTWFHRAAANAFFVMMPALIVAEVVGDLLNLSWLSPVSLVHVLVLGVGTFLVSHVVSHVREA